VFAEGIVMDVLREFLEFIEYSKPQPVAELLSRVLFKSRQLTGAEAGSVFIARGRGKHRRLEAADIQNDRVELEPATFVVPVNTSSIAGYTASTGETVFVADLYNIPRDLPFKFDPSFDRKVGYTSRSMLSFPLVNHDRKVIGVVQLINRLDGSGDGPVPFEREQADLIVPFNHIVGGAIERADMVERISNQNIRLRDRNRLLREQRAHIAALQDSRTRPRRHSSFRSTSCRGRRSCTTRTRPSTSSGSTSTPSSSPAGSAGPRPSATRSVTRPSSTTSAR
jgi:GAF domain-containing protein